MTTDQKDRCFVIQPFDRGRFDKRFRDVFAPAIEKAGLRAYRVDQDYSADIPIEQIERSIQTSVACLADITTNNPNVWYELGFAIATGIPCCIICSSERRGRYPFDIQHRQVIDYSTDSKSDFDMLESKIVKRLQEIRERRLFLDPSRDTTDDAAVSVILTTAVGVDEWEISVPGDVTIGRLIAKLVHTSELGFRESGFDGHPIRYSLRWKEGNRHLGPSETLHAAGVATGNTLVLVPEVTAG